jgi:hypothetical protein
VESLVNGTLTSQEFASFFRCFGSPGGIDEVLEEISGAAPEGESPRFKIGICLGSDRNWFAECWKDAAVDTWALIDGEEEGTFCLFIRGDEMAGTKDQLKTIWVDATTQENRLNFEDK